MSVSGDSAGTVGVGDQYSVYGILAGVNYGTVLSADALGRLDSEDITYYSFFGGLVGVNHGAISCFSLSVGMAEQWNPDGLVGDNDTSGVVEQWYTSCGAYAYGYAGRGGLIGCNIGLIAQSYVTGPVTYAGKYCRGGSFCGGAGLVWSNGVAISQSFATGVVSQDNTYPEQVLPGSIGTFNSGTVANYMYRNKDTMQATVDVFYGVVNPAAYGFTTAQMSKPSYFVSFDFTESGTAASSTTHPALRWQLAH
jgi:hypothetical protein